MKKDIYLDIHTIVNQQLSNIIEKFSNIGFFIHIYKWGKFFFKIRIIDLIK